MGPTLCFGGETLPHSVLPEDRFHSSSLSQGCVTMLCFIGHDSLGRWRQKRMREMGKLGFPGLLKRLIFYSIKNPT
jgi:hypothetical protein